MHTPTLPLPVLALPFNTGFQHYADLAGLVGEHRAHVALRLCVQACNRFDAAVLTKSDSISSSAYINPDDIAGVDILVAGMVVETLKTMHQYQCFVYDGNAQPWEFVEIRAGKLFIQPPNAAVAAAHPLLGISLRNPL